MKTKTGEAGKVKETQETNDTKKKSEVKDTEEDKKIYNTETFNTYIVSSLTSQEKQIESEWTKTIKFQETDYSIIKNRNANYLFMDISDLESIKIYLGKTNFKENNIIFNPSNSFQLLEYINNNRKTKLFQLGTKNLNKTEILDICEKGKGNTIEVKYSPFLRDLNEDIFKDKNQTKNLEDLTLEDLSLFYSEYFPIIENNIQDFKFIDSDERKNFMDSILKKIRREYISPIELYGPFGIGKSTTLMAYQKKLKIKSAYFNLSAIFHLKDKSKYIKMILYESMSLFENYQQFESLKKIIEIMDYDSPWDIIKKVINFVSENIKQTFLIILDQYKEQYEDFKFKSSEKIDSLILNDDTFLRIIKCSSMNDKDVKNNFLNILDKNNYIYIGKLFQIDGLEEREKLYFGNVSLFHYLYLKYEKDFEDFIEYEKTEIKSDIKKSIPNSTNLLKVISNITNIMKSNKLFDEHEIKAILVTIPLKYILINKIEEDGKIFYTFDYPCLLIKIIFEELVIEELKILRETPGIKELRGIIGGIFEIICHFAILRNKINNFELDSKNLFYLEKNLYNQKENEKNWKKNENDSLKVKVLNSFYLRPTSTNSELYDSAIIFKQNNEFAAYLLQMSISKDQGRKITKREEHYKAIEKFKAKMEKVYDIKIKTVYFSYIFNYDEINKDDILECNRYCLDYFYYSVEKDKFYQLYEAERIKNTPIKDKKKYIEEEKKFCCPMNKITFNSTSNMEKTKRSINLIKSKDELNFAQNIFIGMLSKKRNYECTSSILNNLDSIKNIIGKDTDITLEFNEKNKNLNLVLYNLNVPEYFCVIKGNRDKIYGIYNNSEFLYDEKNNKFTQISDDLGTKIFIENEEFEYEIFGLIQENNNNKS